MWPTACFVFFANQCEARKLILEKDDELHDASKLLETIGWLSNSERWLSSGQSPARSGYYERRGRMRIGNTCDQFTRVRK